MRLFIDLIFLTRRVELECTSTSLNATFNAMPLKGRIVNVTIPNCDDADISEGSDTSVYTYVKLSNCRLRIEEHADVNKQVQK